MDDIMSLTKTVGKSILKYRQLRDLSQGDLAKKVGVHRNTIMRWESSECNATLENIQKLAEVLNLQEADLLSESMTPSFLKPADTPEQVSDTAKQAVLLYFKLTPDLAAGIINMKDEESIKLLHVGLSRWITLPNEEKATMHMLVQLITAWLSLPDEDKASIMEATIDLANGDDSASFLEESTKRKA